MTVLPELSRASRMVAVSSQKVGLSQALGNSGVFRSEQLMIIQTGEASGKLEEAFAKLQHDLRDEVRKNVATFEDWMPKIVYGIAMIYAISGIFHTISQVNHINDVNLGN